MIELWSPDDPHARVRCQVREALGGGRCLRFQDHGGGHAYPKQCPICHGSGELSINVERNEWGVWDRDTIPCDRCQGTGDVPR